MAVQPSTEVQVFQDRSHRQGAWGRFFPWRWRPVFLALGIVIPLSIYLFAFGGVSAFYNNLGCLAQVRAWLQIENPACGAPFGAARLNGSDSRPDEPCRAKRDSLLNRAGFSFQEALRWNPHDSRVYHNLGLVYLAWGQKTAARAAFEQAVRLAAHSQPANYRLGFLYDELGQEDKAIAAWQAAGAAPSLVGEGQRCQSDGDAGCAERYYRLALTVQPDYPYAYYRLGVLYTSLERPAEAVEAYNVALALGTEYDPRTHVIQARVLALEQRWEEAIVAYQRAIELNPYDPEPYEQIAAILLRQYQDAEGAIGWYRAAVGLKKGRVESCLRLAEIYQDLRNYPQCEFWYQQALGAGENSPSTIAQIQAGLSRCALAQGNLEAAARAAESAVNARPDVAAYHLLLADVYIEMKSYQLAIASYQVALELDPNNKRAQQQLKELGWREP